MTHDDIRRCHIVSVVESESGFGQFMSEPSVCVIIPSVRNPEELEIALNGLSNQTYSGSLEIIVVGPSNDPGKSVAESKGCLLYTSPSPRDATLSRMPSSA